MPTAKREIKRMRDRVKKFIDTHWGHIIWNTTPETFMRNIKKNADYDRPSGQFAYRLVFVPEGEGPKPRVVYTLKENNGSVYEEYVHKFGNRYIATARGLNKQEVSHLEPHSIEINGSRYYPVLDLIDKRLPKDMVVRVLRSGELKGHVEVIVQIPRNEFEVMRKKMLYALDAKQVEDKLERAMSGEATELDKYERTVVKNVIHILKKTNGSALLPLRKLAPDEREFVWHINEKYSLLDDGMRARLLKSINRSLTGLDIDNKKTIRTFAEFFRKNGIWVTDREIKHWAKVAREGRSIKRV